VRFRCGLYVLLYWRNSEGVSLGSGFSSAVAGVETESAIGSLCGVESVEPIAVDSLNLLMEVCSGKGEL
jgi:hypothetical protein